MNIYNYIEKFRNRKGKRCYRVTKSYVYYSSRYSKLITCAVNMISDGATGAIDINSASWLVHDQLCDTGLFDDGTKCNNLQASAILSDILSEEGRWFRSYTWFITTWLFGGGKARANGLY